MNQILNVRLPNQLRKNAMKFAKNDGYTNIQELVKSLLREYTLERKREELLQLWGSQKKTKISKAEMRALVEKEFDL
jgi:Arc/MetJ-type ribon-helix-helix transcriptional regulator